jgi:hypothetical protein
LPLLRHKFSLTYHGQMRKAPKIYAVIFAFLFAGALAVPAQAADYQVGIDPDGNDCMGGSCAGFSKPDDNPAPVQSRTTNSTGSVQPVGPSQSGGQPTPLPQVGPDAPDDTPEFIIGDFDDGYLDYLPGPVRLIIKVARDAF